MTRGYLGLGSNLGDRLATLLEAVARLDGAPGIRVTRSSRVYETEPVGGPAQPEFLNAVVEVETTLDPRALLAVCLGIEDDLGRIREERWGPRTIDIDVLTFDGAEIDEPDLSIPHPRMQERMFVLAPLLELEPDPFLPGGRHASTMTLDRIDVSGVRVCAPPLR